MIAAFGFSAPAQAEMADAGALAPTYLGHSVVTVGVSELGLNEAPIAATPTPSEAAFAAHLGALPADLPEPLRRTLVELIAEHQAVETADAEQDCLAAAVYFEARGESLEGQLAVAEVVLNRSRSGRYPPTICGVVRQPAQFSFVRRGVIPRADRASEAWRKAVAVARIVQAEATDRLLPRNVLWYHANYVSPSWGRRLERSARIGLHIFYS